MRDNQAAGYGPSYVSSDIGPGWLFWLDDCFDPPVWFLRCETAEEAIEHAEMVLCPEVEEGDLTAEEIAELDDTGSVMGYAYCADGSVRYTETLRMREIWPRNGRRYFRGWE
jgi:hypothetical protein